MEEAKKRHRRTPQERLKDSELEPLKLKLEVELNEARRALKSGRYDDIGAHLNEAVAVNDELFEKRMVANA